MSDDKEPGFDKVTACTRAFEEIDAQIFAGPGRGATRLEAAASDRWGGPSPATVDAYRRMIALVVKHEVAHSDPMKPARPQATDHAGRPDRVASDDSGYAVDEAEVDCWGRCPQCVAAPAVSSAAESGEIAERVDDSLGPRVTNVTSNQSSEGNSEKGEGPTCLTAAAKARAQ